MTTARNKKKSIWKTILIVEILVLIAAGMAALYFLVLKKTPAFEFIGRILSPVEGSKSIKERRVETENPCAYEEPEILQAAVDPESINVLS